MKELNNFVVAWSILLAVTVCLIAKLFISPITFIFDREQYRQSTDYKIERIRVGFRSLEKLFVKFLKHNWKD